jgi:hypothetical protein
MSGSVPVRLGLRENVAQFSLLVAINAFVGAMVGLERSQTSAPERLPSASAGAGCWCSAGHSRCRCRC